MNEKTDSLAWFELYTYVCMLSYEEVTNPKQNDRYDRSFVHVLPETNIIYPEDVTLEKIKWPENISS